MEPDPGDREFEGKVAFVTGAGHGMARATAHMLAARGADLGLVDGDRAELAVVADAVAEVPVVVRFIP